MGEYAGLVQNKYKILDVKSFTKKAEHLGILFSDPIPYEYTYFKVDEAGQKKSFRVLRIKLSDKKKSVDMKIRNDKTGEHSHFESGIDNPKEMKEIFLSLGYEPIVTFHKTRRTYKKDKLRMDIDDIKEIGAYLEVKFPAIEEESTLKLLSELGLKKEDINRRSIVEIYLENNS